MTIVEGDGNGVLVTGAGWILGWSAAKPSGGSGICVPRNGLTATAPPLAFVSSANPPIAGNGAWKKPDRKTAIRFTGGLYHLGSAGRPVVYYLEVD